MGIDHRHFLWLQALHTARDEMCDALDLPRAQGFPAAKGEDDRSPRPLALIRKEGAFGHDQVHTRPLDLGELPDRPGQFALERPSIVQLLHEIGHADRRPVENLKAHAAPLRQTLARELHPQFMDLVARHHHRGAVALHAVRDLLFLEFRDDRARIFRAEVRKQHLHVGFLTPYVPGDDRPDRAAQDQHDKNLPRRRKRAKSVQEFFKHGLLCLPVITASA